MTKSFTVCIVGRPNVGKSTLFNKLTRSRSAIVDGTPGVTRDRIFGRAELGGVDSFLIDTGGFEPAKEEEIVSQVREQAMLAIEEAGAICLVVDGRAGLTPVDEEIAGLLRKSGKPAVIAVNKLDTPVNENDLADFYRLGFDNTIPVSAEHSRGLGELGEALAAGRGSVAPDEEEEVKKPLTVAVVGCPNVGKSSLVNRIIGERRMMVSDIPGTTRDSVDTLVKWHGREIFFIDTAGIRKKNRISQKLEKYSIVMALRSIARANLAVLVIDAAKGITEQDARIAGVINDEARACIVVVNKWDLVDKDNLSTERFKTDLREKLKFLSFAPIIFISAKTGQRLGKVLEEISGVMEEYGKRIPTGPFNRRLKVWTERKPPPITKGRRAKFFYGSQYRSSPPSFSFVVSRPEGIAEEYRRYIVNRIREEYGFEGSPVVCRFRERKRKSRIHAQG
ncbi:MAG: ribosome biogenesis GTPase Der [Nitrospinota bacterium]